jgi:hypothetical protein
MSRKPIKPVFLALALLALLNYLPLVAVAKDDPLHDGLKGRWSEAKCARVDENKKRRFQRRHEKRAAKCAKISSHPMGDWDPFPNGPLGEVGGVSVLDTLIAGYNPSAGRGLLAGSDYTFKLGCLCVAFWVGFGHIEVTVKDVDMTKGSQAVGIAKVHSACLDALTRQVGPVGTVLEGYCLERVRVECQETARMILGPNSSPTSKIIGC